MSEGGAESKSIYQGPQGLVSKGDFIVNTLTLFFMCFIWFSHELSELGGTVQICQDRFSEL